MGWLSVLAPGIASLKCGIRGLVVHQVKWPILSDFPGHLVLTYGRGHLMDEDCPSQESRAKLKVLKKSEQFNQVDHKRLKVVEEFNFC